MQVRNVDSMLRVTARHWASPSLGAADTTEKRPARPVKALPPWLPSADDASTMKPKLFKPTLLIAAGLALAFANLSAAAKGDPVEGKKLVYTCTGCHGIPGYKNAYPNYHVPRLGGQKELYLINALTEYKKGDRKHPTMHAQAESFSAQDIANIAAFLSSLGTPGSADTK